MLNENNNAVIKSNSKPTKKITSAIFSKTILLLVLFLIDKNESVQLHKNKKVANIVISSITVLLFMFNTFNDVNIKKQIPSKFDDALNICCDVGCDGAPMFFKVQISAIQY